MKIIKKLLIIVVAISCLLSLAAGCTPPKNVIDVKGKTFEFESFDAWFSADATDLHKQSAIDMLLFTMDEDPGINEHNFFDYFIPSYENKVLNDGTMRVCTFNEDGRVTYLGTDYTWVQSGSNLTLTSVASYAGKHSVVRLSVVGNTIVHDLTTTDKIVTQTIFKLV